MKKIIALLMAMLCVCSMTVFAYDSEVKGENDKSTDDHQTTINYVVDETYTWQAPADITFTKDSNNKDIQTNAEGSRLQVLSNVIAGDKKLKIIVNDQEFKITTGVAERTYKIYKGADNSGEALLAGGVALEVASGTNTGSQQLAFELQDVDVLQAGTYKGTLSFTASIVAKNA